MGDGFSLPMLVELRLKQNHGWTLHDTFVLTLAL